MKKLFFLILILLIAAGLFWSVPRKKDAVATGPKIVVSGYVPYTLVRQIAGDTAEISMLLPPGAEPHSFEPTPGALVALNQASAFIYVSKEFEPWAVDLVKAVGEKTQVLELAKLIEPSQDPHSWMDFDKAGLMAYQIAALLAKIAPQNRSVTDKNLENFTDRLEQLKQDFQIGLKHCKYREAVHIGHLAFENLLSPYGIKLVALSGTSHEGEHSVKKIVQLVSEIKAKKLPAVFTEEVISQRLAQTVAAETGTEILPLYSVEHVSKQDFDRQVSYIDFMQRNLENLKRGLVCRGY